MGKGDAQYQYVQMKSKDAKGTKKALNMQGKYAMYMQGVNVLYVPTSGPSVDQLSPVEQCQEMLKKAFQSG